MNLGTLETYFLPAFVAQLDQASLKEGSEAVAVIAGTPGRSQGLWCAYFPVDWVWRSLATPTVTYTN